MTVSTYKSLKFWKTSRRVSQKIIKLSRNLPNERIVWIISNQVLRSSFSVGANICEGYGKYKGKEYQRFLKIALGSANETEYWLELLKDTYPNFAEGIDEILRINLETIKMLTSSVKSLTKE